MKNKFLIALLIPFVPLVYIAYKWNNIPETVPLHFDADFNPDRFGAKSELLWIVIFMSCVSILMTLLFKFSPKIDTKNNLENQRGLLKSIGLGTSIFLTIINFYIIQSAMSISKISIMGTLPMLILLFMAFLGNYMINIKQNHFIGIRTPWTLDSESVWKKTHQFAGKLLFFGSIVGIIILLFLPDFKVKIIFMGVWLISIMTFSVWKSYNFYKQESILG